MNVCVFDVQFLLAIVGELKYINHLIAMVGMATMNWP
jgi:hypothetical protein